MATYRKVAVRSVDGWDGMTAAEQSAYDAHYYDLSTMESDEAADLVAIGQGNVVAEVYNDWVDGLETTMYVGGSWVTDADNLLLVTSPSSERTSGIPGTGAKISAVTGGNYLFRNATGTNHVIIDGLEIVGSPSLGIFYSTDNFTVRNCVIYDFTRIANSSSTTYENCVIIFGAVAGTSYIQSAKLHNCTVFSHTNTTLSRLTRDCDCYNVAAYADRALPYGCFYSCTGDYNASSDATAPGGHSLTDLVLSDYEFVDDSPSDGTSYNFHAAETSSIVDAGTPFDDAFVTTIAAYSTDIIGVDRANGIAWDIGAFEFEVGGIQGVPVDIFLLNVVEGSNCIILKTADNDVVLGPTLAPSNGVVSAVFDYLEDTAVIVRVRKSSVGDPVRYWPYIASGVITEDGFTGYVDQVEDSVLN